MGSGTVGILKAARRWGVIALLAVTSAPAGAAEPASPKECYDAVVLARIVRQTPTLFPDCGDRCIVVRWPWILDLNVERVTKGRAPRGRLTVVNLQHTRYEASVTRLWWLKRNRLGDFNVLALGDTRTPAACRADAPKAAPYIIPRPNQTLEDLRAEGERAFGPGPE